MHGDFSRWTHAAHRYRRVLQQQGRMLVDADWNALNASILGEIQSLAADLIGPHGGPETHCGFRVVIDPDALPADDPDRDALVALKAEVEAAPGGASGGGDFYLSAGHYWVGGLLSATDDPTTYHRQPDLPDPAIAPQAAPAEFAQGGYLVYLETWERHVTDLVDPLIREVALLGPDTCTRSQLVWQVKFVPRDGIADVFGEPDETKRHDLARDAAERWRVEQTYPLQRPRRPLNPAPLPAPPPPLLKAWVKPADATDDPCVLPPESRYRGRENQLYRVEIHDGSAINADGIFSNNGVTFTWSRDNGSVTFPLLKLDADSATVEHLGRDHCSSLCAGNWVEVLDDRYILNGLPGPLARVLDVDRDTNRVDLKFADGAALPDLTGKVDTHPFLRRWDYTGEKQTVHGALPLALALADKSYELEAGILVQFAAAVANGPAPRYRTGDYWMIPARTATGNIEWPNGADGKAAALPPLGIVRRYAPLALAFDGATLDVRRKFAELGQD